MSGYSNYISSFIIDPVVRQARRISRLSIDDESPHSALSSFRDWTPSRFWNASPPPSIGEDEADVSDLGGANRDLLIRMPWDTPSNAAPMPSPPPDPVPPIEAHGDVGIRTFSAADPESGRSAPLARRTTNRTISDQSVNPSYGIPERPRQLSDVSQGIASFGSEAMAQRESILAVGEDEQPVASASRAEGHDVARHRSGSLPIDDGMGPMRQRIHAIWHSNGSSAEKSRLIHRLMTERYNTSQTSLQNQQIARPQSPASIISQDRPFTPDSSVSGHQKHNAPDARSAAAHTVSLFHVTAEDLLPTYAPPKPRDPIASNGTDTGDNDVEELPEAEPQLGCIHYKRNVKLQCSACKRWYTCRFCHDQVEDHNLNRRETKNMLCMICHTPQSAAEWCRNCGERAAWYFCPVCKLWDNDPEKSIYHCDDCGICRVGQGLGKDFFHCKTCAVCMSINVEKSHKCIERSTACDCPICGEYMFTSPRPVIFMKCGHSIHAACFKDYCKVSYKCPICTKSIANMESQFRTLDRVIASQPMPEEYTDTRAWVFCNDCNAKSSVMYHWLGLKCDVCESYNTTQLELMNGADPAAPQLEDLPTDDAALGNAILTADIAQPEDSPVDIATGPRAIPDDNSTQRSSFAGNSAVAPSASSPYLLPQRRDARSPVVANYFDMSRQENERRDSVSERESEGIANGQNVDFWGRPFADPEDAVEDLSESDDEEEEDVSEDEILEDDGLEDDDEEDHLDIFGHR